MSKDFELLRRLEEEPRHPQTHSAPIRVLPISTTTLGGVERLRGPRSVIKSPADSLTAAARDQIESMLQKLLPASSSPKLALAFCGVEAGSNTGMIAACAAELLSRTTRSTICIFDAAEGGERISEFFGVSGENPEDKDEPANADSAFTRIHENLWLVEHGSEASSGRFDPALYMADLRRNFNYVFVHADPAVVSHRTTTMGQLCDGLVLILEADVTNRDLVRHVKSQLENAKVQVLGAVLNNCVTPTFDRSGHHPW